MKIYKFRNCYLNTLERRVVRNGVFLDMTPRTFDVLQMLVERPGEIVTKDEILGTVWNGSFVEEGNLPVHISKLRRSLDESRAERFIETVQGTGYRFVSTVEKANEDEWQRLFAGNGHRPSPETPRHLTLDSIAVLPFTNESNNPDIDYIADGLTESLINSLSQISNLRVIARNTVFRYKDKDADPQAVGQTLGVSAVLTGRIRAIKENLIISVELVRASDGSQLWANQFDQPFAEIIDVQGKIFAAVTGKLKKDRNHISEPITESAESFKFYLKGKYFQGKRREADLYQAIDYFQKSVSQDPKNIHSWVETVECYSLLHALDRLSHSDTVLKIAPFLSRISELNQSIDIVQAMWGGIKMYLEWKFLESEKHLHRALELNPSCLMGRYRYADFLTFSGRFSETFEELEKVMQIDLFSVLTDKRLGRVYWKLGRFESAITYLEDALELEPDDYEALLMLGTVLTETGKHADALAVLNRSLGCHFNIETLSMIAYAEALRGEKGKAYKIIEQIKSQTSNVLIPLVSLTRIYVALGENEAALEFLERAYERHEVDLIGLRYDPRLKGIKNEPRFQDLVLKVGVPDCYRD